VPLDVTSEVIVLMSQRPKHVVPDEKNSVDRELSFAGFRGGSRESAQDGDRWYVRQPRLV
jgi:hypothetical protein